MIKNQPIRGTFILKPPFYKSRKDKRFSKLLPLLQFSLHVVIQV